MLVHTSSTHATEEWGTAPWSTRDHFVRFNIQPDGTASGALIELMRNMLVREQNGDLHVFSALSPEWIRPGRTLAVKNEPTAFGAVSIQLRSSEEGLDISLGNNFRQAPRRIVIHLPWYYQAGAIDVDGRPAQAAGLELPVAAGTKRIRIAGKIRPDAPAMSYDQAVADYLREYRRRYESFLQPAKFSHETRNGRERGALAGLRAAAIWLAGGPLPCMDRIRCPGRGCLTRQHRRRAPTP